MLRVKKKPLDALLKARAVVLKRGGAMWLVIFAFTVLACLIIKQEKTFNKSILILEERINAQQHQINKLNERVSDLERDKTSG